MANGNAGGTPAVAGPVSQGMAGTPATAGPVSTTGQGSGPGGNAGVGASMTGPEGQFAKAPVDKASQVKIGPDGEPEPVGNKAQRLAGAAVAATFSAKGVKQLKALQGVEETKPEVKAPVKAEKPVSDAEEKIVELEKKVSVLQNAASLTPEQMAVILGQPIKAEEVKTEEVKDSNPDLLSQAEITEVYQQITEDGKTQSTPTENVVGAQNFQVQGQGKSEPPK